MRLTTRAPAKLNLSLHVRGRRDDGYHTLESLVVFASLADHLSLDPDQPDGLIVEGPFTQAAGKDQDNLVLKALHHLREARPGLRSGFFRLVKYLPAQAGLGGGSADAAAALRLLARLNGLLLDDPELLEAARRTGADVSVCLLSRPVMMRGIGEQLGSVLDLPKLHAVLVKPDCGMSTPQVFVHLGLAKGESTGVAAHPEPESGTAQALIQQLGTLRNDLEPAACALEPQIGQALARLRAQEGCQLARMSGSGSAVFGLFASALETKGAARAIKRDHPEWWIKTAVLG